MSCVLQNPHHHQVPGNIRAVGLLDVRLQPHPCRCRRPSWHQPFQLSSYSLLSNQPLLLHLYHKLFSPGARIPLQGELALHVGRLWCIFLVSTTYAPGAGLALVFCSQSIPTLALGHRRCHPVACSNASTTTAAQEQALPPVVEGNTRAESHGISVAPEGGVALLSYSELQMEREIGQGSYGKV